jgi:hypothetical protein
VSNILAITAEQVGKAREQGPFEPFTICLSEQRRFEMPLVDLVHVTSLKLDGGGDGSPAFFIRSGV